MKLLSSLYRPIPKLKKFIWSGVRKIDIVEEKEKLVPLSLVPEKILVRPQYYLQGINGALPECYIRKGNLSRLVNVAGKLPAGYKLLIFDAWRSEKVQLDLYNRLYEELKKQMPDKKEYELKEMTEEFVALPSDKPEFPSPHITGGAVDLTIVNNKGIMLDMGTGFDETDVRTHTRYYEELLAGGKTLNDREAEILSNRRLLYSVMTSEGYTNYPNEWWHFDYGNQNWAYMKDDGKPAIYGSASPHMRWKFE